MITIGPARAPGWARVAVAAAAAVVVLAGCAPTPGPVDGTGTGTAAAPLASAMPAAARAAADPNCGNPVQSFDPMAQLPVPGAMPAGTTMDTIRKRNRLIAGVSADTLLFGARNPLTGQIEGFDIDMLHAVAKAILGDENKIEFKVITYAQRLPSLQNHSVDIVAHTMTINCQRWAAINFSAEYYHAGQKVLVRSDAVKHGIRGIRNLDGKRVCAAKGSTNIDNLKAYPKVIVVGVDDLTDCLVRFQQGSVDAITADDTVLAGFAAQDPYAKVVGDRFTDEPYGLGIAKDHPDLVQFVNAVLAQVMQDGRWQKSYLMWLKGSPPAPPTPMYGRRP